MAYSGIEVVPPHDPEVRQPDLYTAHATGQSEKRGQVHGYYEVTNDATQKRIWGLRRTTFWLSAVLCTVIILAIAIGAGVGVSQRSQGIVPECTNHTCEVSNFDKGDQRPARTSRTWRRLS
ncbi:hypothetical protein FH972_021811 [Carpinus fangiana]|uniref:Uncharacterized protein n=1 Tax=Carpinus fangiana TaxID=176857 RepID=A0A5N6KQR9_9ROSI|nr:hypothetical protein FH972_021811 [Carpinus fangiana]